MIILGLATMGTSAACLMRDGEIVAAVEEERLSRIKNDGAFPLRAIAECLGVAGVTMAEVDASGCNWNSSASCRPMRSASSSFSSGSWSSSRGHAG